MKQIDWLAAIGYIASGGGAIVVTALSTAFPNEAVKIIAFGSIAVFTASILVRLYNNKTDKPATSIIENAPIVAPETPVYTPGTTPTVGTNTHTES